ncbi:MAG TPA: nuclear transport factor 2 family protein [Thermoanaerobaculia bacterium]
MRHVLLTALLCVLIAGCASTPTVANDEAAVIETLHAACRAYQQADVAKMTELLTPDFTLTDPDGIVTSREDDLQIARNGSIVYRVFENRDMKVRLHGDAAVVTGITRVAGNAGATQFETDLQFTDSVVRENGKWRVAASHVSRIKR